MEHASMHLLSALWYSIYYNQMSFECMYVWYLFWNVYIFSFQASINLRKTNYKVDIRKIWYAFFINPIETDRKTYFCYVFDFYFSLIYLTDALWDWKDRFLNSSIQFTYFYIFSNHVKICLKCFNESCLYCMPFGWSECHFCSNQENWASTLGIELYFNLILIGFNIISIITIINI